MIHQTSLAAVGIASVVSLSSAVLSEGLESGVSIEPSPQWSVVPDQTALTHEHAPNSLMIRFLESVSPADRAALIAAVGGTVEVEYRLVPDLVGISTRLSVAEALEVLGNRDDVLRYVEPNFIYRTFAESNDPIDLYGMEQINAPAAWDDHVGDSSFRIAVIDTGCDYNHPDLVDNMWRNLPELNGVPGVDDDGNGYVDDIYGYDFAAGDSDPSDPNGHGSHCGGTIAAQGNNGVGVVGVMWEASLVSVPFLGGSGGGTLQGAVQAVEYCEVMDIKISSNSWGGGGYSQSMYDAIQLAGEADCHIFCAAAGNSGSNGASYPAAYDLPNVVSVLATDQNEQRAGFSQYGSNVDIGAPGVDIVSTTPNNGYSSYSGTSMACPHVSGVLGLVYSLMPDACYTDVIDIVMSSARPVSQLDGLCVTGAIVDADKALENTFQGPVITVLSSIPESLDPGVGQNLAIDVNVREDVLVSGSVRLNYRMGSSGPFTALSMTQTLNGWQATIPPASCDQGPEFYFSVEGVTAGAVTNPPNGDSAPYGYFIGDSVVKFADNFNSDNGWSVQSDVADGAWSRGIPVPGCNRGNPSSDRDGSGACFLTDNSSANDCNSDVDEGTTTLFSPTFDGTGSDDIQVSFSRWFSNDFGNAPGTDTMVNSISNDGGQTWTVVESVGPTGAGTTGGWVDVSFRIADVITPSATMQMRFEVSDLGADTQSVVEAGIDAFSVDFIECVETPDCPEDLTNDGLIDVSDILALLAGFGTAESDVNGDGVADVQDVLDLLAVFGQSC